MSDDKKETRVEKIKNWFADNKIFSIVIFIGVAIVAMGSVVKSCGDIRNAFQGNKDPKESNDLAGVLKEIQKSDSIKLIIRPFKINPISDKDKKIATFRLNETNPTVSLKFIAIKSDIAVNFKVWKKTKCSDLCNAIVNHFELLNSITLDNAAVKIKPTLVVNSMYILGEQTLEEQGIQDGDIVNISYDYSGSVFALSNPFIWNDSLIYTESKYGISQQASLEFKPFTKYGNTWKKNEAILTVDATNDIRPNKIIVNGNETQNLLGIF